MPTRTTKIPRVRGETTKFAREQFIAWYCSEPGIALNRTVVLRFGLHLESLGLPYTYLGRNRGNSTRWLHFPPLHREETC